MFRGVCLYLDTTTFLFGTTGNRYAFLLTVYFGRCGMSSEIILNLVGKVRSSYHALIEQENRAVLLPS